MPVLCYRRHGKYRDGGETWQFQKGCFCSAPGLPAGEDGLKRLESWAGTALVPKLRGQVSPEGDETEEGAVRRAEQFGRLGEWQRLQMWVGSAVRHWFATLPLETRARMDPQLLARFAPDQNLGPQMAALYLRADLEQLFNSIMMPGVFAIDEHYRLQLNAKTLTHLIAQQLLNAIQTQRAFGLCTHCGKPFPLSGRQRGIAALLARRLPPVPARLEVDVRGRHRSAHMTFPGGCT